MVSGPSNPGLWKCMLASKVQPLKRAVVGTHTQGVLACHSDPNMINITQQHWVVSLSRNTANVVIHKPKNQQKRKQRAIRQDTRWQHHRWCRKQRLTPTTNSGRSLPGAHCMPEHTTFTHSGFRPCCHSLDSSCMHAAHLGPTSDECNTGHSCESNTSTNMNVTLHD